MVVVARRNGREIDVGGLVLSSCRRFEIAFEIGDGIME